jgi:hypothetical protein
MFWTGTAGAGCFFRWWRCESRACASCESASNMEVEMLQKANVKSVGSLLRSSFQGC